MSVGNMYIYIYTHMRRACDLYPNMIRFVMLHYLCNVMYFKVISCIRRFRRTGDKRDAGLLSICMPVWLRRWFHERKERSEMIERVTEKLLMTFG